MVYSCGAVSYRLSCISSAQRGVTPRVSNECPILHFPRVERKERCVLHFSFFSFQVFTRMETIDEDLSDDRLVLGLKWVIYRMCCALMLLFENCQ